MDMTDMHRVFNIAEVVAEIVAHVDQPTLLALAQTAKVFEHPAYARLYSSVDETCLRALAKRMVVASGDNQRDTISRSRCLSHARLVRSVTLGVRPSRMEYLIFSEDVHTAVTLLRRPFYPFPCLRSLEVFAPSPADLQLVDVLLCPTLKSLTFALCISTPEEVPRWEGQMFGFLEGLPEKAGNISELNIVRVSRQTNRWKAAFETNFANALGRACRSLPIVNFFAHNIVVTPELLGELAKVDTLGTIRMRMPAFSSASFLAGQSLEPSLNDTSFCSLKKANLRGGRIIGDVVKSLVEAELQVLSVEISEWSPQIATLFEAVCAFAGTLEMVHFHQAPEPDFSLESFRSYKLPGHAFARLACCGMMQDFSFTFGAASKPVVDLAQSDMERLAKGWPMLKKLHVNYGWKTGVEAPLTIAALLPFALHCPDLRQIAIDPLSATLDVQVPLPSVPAHPWKDLGIGYPQSFGVLPWPTAATLAHYLDTLWPDVRVRILGAGPAGRFGLGERTRQAMNDLLRSLRVARAMRPGSRFLLQHPGECSLAVVERDLYRKTWVNSVDWVDDRVAYAFGRVEECPWEIVAPYIPSSEQQIEDDGSDIE